MLTPGMVKHLVEEERKERKGEEGRKERRGEGRGGEERKGKARCGQVRGEEDRRTRSHEPRRSEKPVSGSWFCTPADSADSSSAKMVAKK